MKGFGKLTPMLQRLASERMREKVPHDIEKMKQGDSFIRREIERVGDTTLLKLYGVAGTVVGVSTAGYEVFMPGFLFVLAALPPVGYVPLPDVTTCSGMISDWIQRIANQHRLERVKEDADLKQLDTGSVWRRGG